MSYLDKHVVRKMEQQYLKDVKHFFQYIQELNEQLNEQLKKIEPLIDKEKYEEIINYIEQYVVYTDIWHLRFTNNLQNIEIAVLQIILLEHLYQSENNIADAEDQQMLIELKGQLLTLNDHATRLLEIHRKKLDTYINSNPNT